MMKNTRKHTRVRRPYSLWFVSCLFAAALLLVVIAALMAEPRLEDPLAERDSLNKELEQTLMEWEAAKGVEYALVDGKVPINSAPSGQLETLPGIGPAKSKAIIAYREEHGPFADIEQLQNVKGIGAKTFEKLKAQITTSMPDTEPAAALP